jgi:8-oxo-dGTP diphosphatase
MNWTISVKSFIVKDNKLLLIKRRPNDPNAPSAWEIPGGRLSIGEDPHTGLKRETKEETGIDIEIKNPLTVRHFTRHDNQKITMITFLCKPISQSIILSEEHTEHLWLSLDQAHSIIWPDFQKDINVLKELFSDSGEKTL